MSYFQRTGPDCKNESFYTTGRQKKTDCFSVDGFFSHCNTVFEAMDCFYHFRVALKDDYRKKRMDMLAYTPVEFNYLETFAKTFIVPTRRN